jgi:superfamily I DNA/RNA helicase
LFVFRLKELGANLFDAFDVLLIDEAHDLSPCELSIFEAEHRKKPKRMRTIIVFDPHQAIYGFRGAADCKQLLSMKSNFDTFPLRRTFRFGHGVAALANAVIKKYKPSCTIEITAASKETTVESVCVDSGTEGRQAMYSAAFGNSTEGDCGEFHGELTVLARSNLRVVEEALHAAGEDMVESIEFVNQSSGAHEKILRDLRQIAEKGINPSGATWMPKFENVEKVKTWAERTGKKEMVSLIGLVDYFGAQEVLDRIDLIAAKTHQRHAPPQHSSFSSAAAVKNNSSSAPQQTGTQGLHVILSTTHGAKGLGWPQVYVAGDFLGGDEDVFETSVESSSEWAVTDFYENGGGEHAKPKQIDDEEVNCFYVAITRAKRRLWINSNVVQLLQKKGIGLDVHPFPKENQSSSRRSNIEKKHKCLLSQYRPPQDGYRRDSRRENKDDNTYCISDNSSSCSTPPGSPLSVKDDVGTVAGTKGDVGSVVDLSVDSEDDDGKETDLNDFQFMSSYPKPPSV